VLGCDDHDVVRSTTANARHVQRLRVDLTVDAIGEEFAEAFVVHEHWREERFGAILPRSRTVVMPREHAGEATERRT